MQHIENSALAPSAHSSVQGAEPTAEHILDGKVTELLARANQEIRLGEARLRNAAKYIAAAQEQGANQRQIALALGRSPAWVNRLLSWYKNGCPDSPFGPQAKAKRQRARLVQAPEQKKEMPESPDQQIQAAAKSSNAMQIKAEVETTGSTDNKPADARHEAETCLFDLFETRIESSPRLLLVKGLGMLASAHAGERANAAVFVEKQRAKLDLTWDELIIPAS